MSIAPTLLAVCARISSRSQSHTGGLDWYGCHYDRKAKVNDYHCHDGPFANRHFKSKQAMLSELGSIPTSRRSLILTRLVYDVDGRASFV